MPDPLSTVRSGYDRWSIVYDHDANPLPPLEEPIARAMLGNVAGLTALDLGCGTGRHAIALAAAGAAVTAVDFSEGMLAEARRKSEQVSITFIMHDLKRSLPFGEEGFDVVISGLVIEHLNDLDRFFGEIARVLKSGGRAVVTGMHPSMFLRGSQARFTDPETGLIVQPGSVPHSFGSIVMAVLQSGLEIEDLQEAAPDASFAQRYPRSAKYLDWPMVFGLRLSRRKLEGLRPQRRVQAPERSRPTPSA